MLYKLLLAVALTLSPWFVAPAEAAPPAPPGKFLTLTGATKYKPYTLVRLKADGIDPKAGIVWRVYPAANVQRATSPRGVLEFVAPPGVYQVEALVIKAAPDGSVEVEEQAISVEIESCCDKVPPVVPPAPMPPGPPAPPKKADPLNALGRIQFGTAGCTATVIGPRRADGRWDVLTAAHCVTNVGVGAKGTMKLKDGRTLGVKVVNITETPDCAWLVTDDATVPDLAFAEIAAANPAPGVAIWHAGYGVDKPGNREDGTVTAAQNTDGQVEMSLSVSSGDSGGGIFRADTGELIACVCCTTVKGAKARVWGCAAVVARKLRPEATSAEPEAEWTPTDIPTWAPLAIPIREQLPWWPMVRQSR